jgi:hypothetical protein
MKIFLSFFATPKEISIKGQHGKGDAGKEKGRK